MKPIILHSDMNNFYASVEILYDPTLKNKPVAVTGDEGARHGIVLAKNDLAKQFGIRTGQVLWEARQQCPELVCVPAHYERYLHFSALARDIYVSYTDQVESFGLDECWLDVTGSTGLFGDGADIADDIRNRIRHELGLTVSVGESYNKVFAKLGSDMKSRTSPLLSHRKTSVKQLGGCRLATCFMSGLLLHESWRSSASIRLAHWLRVTKISSIPCWVKTGSCSTVLRMGRIVPASDGTMLCRL